MGVAPASRARAYVASASGTYRCVVMGRCGYCSLASPSSITEFPIATSPCMIEPSGRGTRMRSVPSKAETRKSMNCGAPFTRKYGAMFGKLGRRNCADFPGSGDGAAASCIEVLLCKSDFSAALKSGRGKARRGRTRANSAAILGLSFASGSCCAADSSALMARSSCSAGDRLGMAIPYLCAQSLERTELELLDGALRFAEAPGDFADAAFLDEALTEDTALHVGKLIDETKKMNVPLDEIQVS